MLPASSPVANAPTPAVTPAPLAAAEAEEDEDWKQLIGDDSEESEIQDSGSDSDADVPHHHHADRHKNDLDILAKLHQKKPPQSKSQKVASSAEAAASSEPPMKEDEEAEEEAPGMEALSQIRGDEASANDAEEGNSSDRPLAKLQVSTPTSGAKKQGIISRLFGGKSKNSTLEYQVPAGASLLKEDIGKFSSKWYEQQLSRLGMKDGISCTKVATNGKPYERQVALDSRNLTVEIRGGRSGTAGVLMDDLVDVRQGLASADFEQFLERIKGGRAGHTGLDTKAVVLQTPSRTFSLLMHDRHERDALAYCILHLLKTKNRGVMAGADGASPAGKGATQAPKTGHGKVTYANKSSYEGQFQNYMRHGAGVLTLSDSTKYDAHWKNDERHGEGKELCPDGTTFVGHYVSGMRHGNGVMTWPEGSKYSGKFERGRANGEGELLRTDGSVYRGEFSEDCMSGEGRMQWRDGVEYMGQFVANKREGFGKMTWTSGRWQKYIGQWKDGMQHEVGTLVDHQSQEFKGFFKLGKLDYWMDD